MSNSQKNFLSIRSKLVAAVAMLLVASFMVVSSTYAWFTLSTAPEVTGITTQIGANGSLEIALYTGNAILNGSGLTNKTQSNLTWGNIIDLDDPSYGLSNIVLKPSTLSVTAVGDKITINTAMPLVTPTYGSDGRVQKVEANGFYGTYETSGFVKKDVISDDTANSGYGVRALGTVSTMTAQQLQYNTSSTAIKTALASAANSSEASLEANGPALVSLIVKVALDDTATLTADDIAPINGMITTLSKAPAQLKDAVKHYILLNLAKTMEANTDDEFKAVVALFNAQWDADNGIFAQLIAGETVPNTVTITVPAVGEAQATTQSVPVPAKVKPVVVAYKTVSAKLATATGAYTTAIEKETIGFEDLKTILASLMNVTELSINGSGYNDLIGLPMQNPDPAPERTEEKPYISKMDWASNLVLNDREVKMLLSKDSGVYADIAKVTQNLNAKFVTDENFGAMGMQAPNFPVQIYTNLKADEMNVLNPSDVAKPADKGADANAVISDTYAYVLDFAFRTNAANSSLLLQQEATDRIYGSNTDTTAATWGGGSYMQFNTVANSGFDAKTIATKLLGNIRIVFADTLTGEILAGAGLDPDSVEYDSEGNVVLSDLDSSFKAAVVLCEYDVNAEGYLEFGEFLDEDNQDIAALGQNQEKHISVYVYLDGLTTTNESVAALSSLSANAKLNLQFASSAPLVPMDYSDLKNQNQNAEQTTASSTTASSTTAEETTAAGA